MTLRHGNFRGLLLVVGILVITVLASARGYLAFFNGVVYDATSRLPLRAFEASRSPVLRIDLDAVAYHSDDDAWRGLLAALTVALPKQIVLLERPSDLDTSTYRELGRVVSLVGVAALPWAAEGAAALVPAQAWSRKPLADHGVFRRLTLLPTAEQGETLLTQAARGHRGGVAIPAEVYPNFLAGSGRVPQLPAARLVAGEIPPSLLVGRTLMVAPAPGPSATGLFTPGPRGAVADVAAFKAHALHSLLTDQHMLLFPLLNTVALLLVLAVGCLYFYQRASFELALYGTFAMLSVSLIVSALMLHGVFVLFPLTEVVVVVLGMWVAVLNRKYLTEQRGMLLELNNITRLMRKRLVPVDLLHSDGYWENIAHMVQRLLQLDRSIFLEAMPGERRVREIHAIGCNVDDIDERRRDYERTPYTTAIEARRPTTVQGYLAGQDDGEQQYLVPLQLEGTVLGFWAFGVERAHVDEGKLAAVTRFAEDLSELLHQRRQVLEAERDEQRRWLDYLTLQGGRSLARDLKAALGVTTRRLRMIEDLFAHSSTAYLVYDAFGHLLLDNPAAAALCEQLEVEAYELSYTDMLSHLSGHDLDAAKSVLQRVVLHGESVRLPLDCGAEGPAGSLLVRTLAGAATDEEAGASDGSALTLSGVIIEVQLRAGDGFGFEAMFMLGLREALARAAESQAAVLARKKVQLDLPAACAEVTPLLPATQLTRVLSELLSFVVADAKRGSRIQVTCASGSPLLQITIASDGIGVPAQHLRELLGDGGGEHSPLVRCRAVVEAIGGELCVESQVGKGTLIKLCLPAAPTRVSR